MMRMVATLASTMTEAPWDVDNAASMPEQCLFFCFLLGAAVEWRHCAIDLYITIFLSRLFYIHLSKQGEL